MQDNLDKDTISNLNELQTLDLSKNDIKTIPRKTFYTPRSNLRVLDLSRNKINDISNGAFDGLEKVEMLKIRGNQITMLYSSMFSQLKNLKQLELAKCNRGECFQ